MTRVLLIGWLTALWLVLWRDVSVANVLSGVAVGLVVLAVFPARRVPGRHALRPLHLAVFAGYFAWKLVVSNLVVAREIVTPRDNVRSGIVAVPMTECSDLVV
ncbi:MAG TPA: Na+/H+ antiporter subunit E, partial [Acidimicrobiales bacterium]